MIVPAAEIMTTRMSKTTPVLIAPRVCQIFRIVFQIAEWTVAAICSPSPFTGKHVPHHYLKLSEVTEIPVISRYGSSSASLQFEAYHTADWTSAGFCAGS